MHWGVYLGVLLVAIETSNHVSPDYDPFYPTAPGPANPEAGWWLLIGTGNADSFAARIAGSRWTYMCIPKHLSFFSLRSIWKGLRKVGFSPVDFASSEFLAQYLFDHWFALLDDNLVSPLMRRAYDHH
jgi:hypothetical protein